MDLVYIIQRISSTELSKNEIIRKLRADCYPKIGDQLDCFWHAMDSKILPKIEPFYTDILEVKTKYPF